MATLRANDLSKRLIKLNDILCAEKLSREQFINLSEEKNKVEKELAAEPEDESSNADAFDIKKGGLLKAVQAANLQEVRRLCRHDAIFKFINWAEPVEGTTALIKATMYDLTEIVNVLLEAGADPMLLDARGRSALMMAAANGSDGSVKRLLKAGAPCSTTATSNGWNAFMFAARRGHIATSNLLLEAGGAQVSLYTCAHDGKSAIQLAKLNSGVGMSLTSVDTLSQVLTHVSPLPARCVPSHFIADEVKVARMIRFLKEATEANPKADESKADDSKVAAGGDAGGASKSSKRESSKRGRAHATAGGRGAADYAAEASHEDSEGRAQERSSVEAGNGEAAAADGVGGGIGGEMSASQPPPLPNRKGKAASVHASTAEARRKRAERRGTPRACSASASDSASDSAAAKATGEGHKVLAAAVKAEVEKEAAAMVVAARSTQQTQQLLQSPARDPSDNATSPAAGLDLTRPAAASLDLTRPAAAGLDLTRPAAAGLAGTSRWRSLQQLMHSAGGPPPAAPAAPASPAATGVAAASRWKALQQLSVASTIAAAFTAFGSASDSFLKGASDSFTASGSFKRTSGSFRRQPAAARELQRPTPTTHAMHVHPPMCMHSMHCVAEGRGVHCVCCR